MKGHSAAMNGRLLAALQLDLPCERRPFACLAERVGVSEGELLESLRAGLDDGLIRRYGARVQHHSAGYQANVMVVWQVAPESVEEVGGKLALHPAVSHCYERPTFEDFPYNLYTMIHGKSRADCERVIAELQAVTGVREFAALWTKREFKKSAPRYL